MLGGTPSWRMRMPTCKCRAAESLSRRQCITLCDSTAETECTPDTYRVILLRTAAFACHSNTPLRFLMLCRLGLPSLYSAGHRSTATTQASRNAVFRGVRVSARSWIHDLHRRLLQRGGGNTRFENQVSHCSHGPAGRFRSEEALDYKRPAKGRWLQVFLTSLSGWCWRSSARS